MAFKSVFKEGIIQEFSDISLEEELERRKKIVAAEKIIHVLSSRAFNDWNKRDFEAYIGGDIPAPTKEQILQDIIRIFKL